MRAGLVGVAVLLVLSGCGGSAEAPAGRLVATLGDSITAGSPAYDPDPRMRETLGFGADEKSQWQYWAQRAHPELRFRNCGIYGQRTDEIGLRLDECAKGAQMLVVQGGINDIAQGRSVEVAAENLRSMVRQGKKRGLEVAVAEVLPWNNGYPDADRADPAPERADPRNRPRRARPGAAVLRDAPGPAAIRADARGMDVRRRPPLDRGIPAARREGLPGGLDSLNSAGFPRGLAGSGIPRTGETRPPRGADASLDVAIDTSTLGPAHHRRLGLRRRTRVSDVLDVEVGLTAPAKPPRLLLRFGLYAGVALLLAAAAGTWFAGHNARARAERGVWADAHYTADQLARDDLAKVALAAPVTRPDVRASLDELFGRVALPRGVVRVTLFGRSGVVTYSTDHSLIGKMPYDLAQVRKAMAGAEVHGTSQLHGGVGANPTVLHSYAPVYWYFDKNSSPNGVIGVYREYAPVAQAIRSETLIRAAVIISALLILYIALFPILRGVMRTLEARNRQLVRQADALRESEEQYRLIVETAAEGVALLDAEGRIVFANQKLAELLGRSNGMLPGSALVELMDEHSRAAADPRWFRMRNEQREFAFVLPSGGLVHTVISVESDPRPRRRLQRLADDGHGRDRAAAGRGGARTRWSQARPVARPPAHPAGGVDRPRLRPLADGDLGLQRVPPEPARFRATRSSARSRSCARAPQGIVPLTRQLLAISRRESLRSGLVDLASGARRARAAVPAPRRRRTSGSRSHPIRRSAVSRPTLPRSSRCSSTSCSSPARRCRTDGRISIEARNADLDESFAKEHFPMRPGRYVLPVHLRRRPRTRRAGSAQHLFSPLFAGGRRGRRRPRPRDRVRDRQAERRASSGSTASPGAGRNVPHLLPARLRSRSTAARVSSYSRGRSSPATTGGGTDVETHLPIASGAGRTRPSRRAALPSGVALPVRVLGGPRGRRLPARTKRRTALLARLGWTPAFEHHLRPACGRRPRARTRRRRAPGRLRPVHRARRTAGRARRPASPCREHAGRPAGGRRLGRDRRRRGAERALVPGVPTAAGRSSRGWRRPTTARRSSRSSPRTWTSSSSSPVSTAT